MTLEARILFKTSAGLFESVKASPATRDGSIGEARIEGTREEQNDFSESSLMRPCLN
jgi:hypothetical protein